MTNIYKYYDIENNSYSYDEIYFYDGFYYSKSTNKLICRVEILKENETKN